MYRPIQIYHCWHIDISKQAQHILFFFLLVIFQDLSKIIFQGGVPLLIKPDVSTAAVAIIFSGSSAYCSAPSVTDNATLQPVALI